MLLYRSPNAHVYAFSRGPGRFSRNGRRKRGSFPAYGWAVRVRDPRGTGCWRHWRFRIGWQGPSEVGRGVGQVELDSWRTIGGTGITSRVGTKMFVRFKVGLGARGSDDV